MPFLFIFLFTLLRRVFIWFYDFRLYFTIHFLRYTKFNKIYIQMRIFAAIAKFKCESSIKSDAIICIFYQIKFYAISFWELRLSKSRKIFSSFHHDHFKELSDFYQKLQQSEVAIFSPSKRIQYYLFECIKGNRTLEIIQQIAKHRAQSLACLKLFIRYIWIHCIKRFHRKKSNSQKQYLIGWVTEFSSHTLKHLLHEASKLVVVFIFCSIRWSYCCWRKSW